VRNYRDTLAANHESTKLLHLALLERGIACAPRGMFVTSTVMTRGDVDELVAAVRDIAPVLAG
jgi:glutamate-1-semialdehyde aminotransferase